MPSGFDPPPSSLPGSRWGSNASLMSMNSDKGETAEPARKRGRPSKKPSVSTPQSSTQQSSTQQSNNMYTILKDNVQVPETSSANNKKSQKNPPTTKEKVPQFVIYNCKLVTIYEILDNIIPNCGNAYGSYIKLGRHGTKVFVDNNEQYRQLRKVCDTRGIHYHCHPLSDEMLDKFVMYGLHADTPTERIKSALASVEAIPHAIINLNIKKPRWDGHATYQIQFKRSNNVTLEQLQEIRAICFLKVRFERYRGRGFISICPNCLKPGHGSTGCGLPARCIKCGETHKSIECPEREDKSNPKSKIPDEKVKCANCSENHPANYRGCSVLKQYAMDQTIARQRVAMRNKANTSRYTYNEQQFPTLTKNRSIAAHLSTNSQSYAEAFKNPAPKGNLLSMNEALGLFHNLYNRLTKCRTREQQGEVILQYTLQLINHGSP